MRNAAVYLAAVHGFSVFPFHRYRPDSLTAKGASNDVQHVARADYFGDCTIGVATGAPSGVFVVRAHEDLVHGDYHLTSFIHNAAGLSDYYFKLPRDRVVHSQFGRPLQTPIQSVRSDGAYCLLTAEDVPRIYIHDAPEWLLDLVAPREKVVDSGTLDNAWAAILATDTGKRLRYAPQRYGHGGNQCVLLDGRVLRASDIDAILAATPRWRDPLCWPPGDDARSFLSSLMLSGVDKYLPEASIDELYSITGPHRTGKLDLLLNPFTVLRAIGDRNIAQGLTESALVEAEPEPVAVEPVAEALTLPTINLTERQDSEVLDDAWAALLARPDGKTLRYTPHGFASGLKGILFNGRLITQSDLEVLLIQSARWERTRATEPHEGPTRDGTITVSASLPRMLSFYLFSDCAKRLPEATIDEIRMMRR